MKLIETIIFVCLTVETIISLHISEIKNEQEIVSELPNIHIEEKVGRVLENLPECVNEIKDRGRLHRPSQMQCRRTRRVFEGLLDILEKLGVVEPGSTYKEIKLHGIKNDKRQRKFMKVTRPPDQPDGTNRPDSGMSTYLLCFLHSTGVFQKCMKDQKETFDADDDGEIAQRARFQLSFSITGTTTEAPKVSNEEEEEKRNELAECIKSSYDVFRLCTSGGERTKHDSSEETGDLTYRNKNNQKTNHRQTVTVKHRQEEN